MSGKWRNVIAAARSSTFCPRTRSIKIHGRRSPPRRNRSAHLRPTGRKASPPPSHALLRARKTLYSSESPVSADETNHPPTPPFRSGREPPCAGPPARTGGPCARRTGHAPSAECRRPRPGIRPDPRSDRTAAVGGEVMGAEEPPHGSSEGPHGGGGRSLTLVACAPWAGREVFDHGRRCVPGGESL